MPVSLTCRHCAVGFRRPPSQAHLAFCSRECWYVFAKGKGLTGKITAREKACASCGRTFTARSGSVFCSRACINKGRVSPKRIARETFTCRWCNAAFSKLACQSKNGRGGFCSRSCVAAHTSANSGWNTPSKPERQFLDLCSSQGFETDRQVRFGPYSIDGMSQNRRIAIEFDGTYWHSLPRILAKDLRKDAYLAQRGVQLVRIPEQLYRESPERAIQLVAEAFQ